MRRLLFTVLCVCLLSTGAFAQTSGSPGGLVVFETFGSGNAADATRAGVLAGVMTTHTVLFATSSPRLARNLGIAIVNPNGVTVIVTLTLRRGSDGVTSSVKSFAIAARRQTALFMSQIFADVPQLPLGFDGSLSVTSDFPVAIVGLRFRGTNFSTIPITSLSPPVPVPYIAARVGGPDSVILPQFASGGGWSSEIVISNTTAVPLPVRLDLFKQDGSPLTTILRGQSGSSFQDLIIPAQGILIEDNIDNGPLQVGYAIITPIDAIPPTVTSTVPVNGDFDVPVNRRVTATFSESMDPSTLDKTTFTLARGTSATLGAVTYAGTTATFTPATDLALNTTYTATITTGAKDLSDNTLASNYVWSFTTVAAVEPPIVPPGTPPPPPPPHLGPLTVALGAAAPYGILAGSGVSSSSTFVNPTIINGSLGSSPTGTLVGFPPADPGTSGIVNGGTIDLANPAAAAAKLALTTAFNDAAARTLNVISLPGNINGLTLAPGLYKNSSSVQLSVGGKVYLDAQGDSTAVWIFQMGSTLTTFDNTEVVLAGGAKAANIFWQVGTSATLGGSSIFKGNILADQSISVGTNAVVEGRLLTRIAAVTLLSNVVTVPVP